MNSTSTTGCAVTNSSQVELSGFRALPGGWHPFKALAEHLRLAPAGTMASPRPSVALPKLLPTHTVAASATQRQPVYSVKAVCQGRDYL